MNGREESAAPLGLDAQAGECERELLRQSLAAPLEASREAWLAHHLAECEPCRLELERLAACESDWSRIAESLRSGVRSGAVGRDAASSPSSSAVSTAARDDSEFLAVDFAVDFLEPSTTPDMLGKLGHIEVVEPIGRGGMGLVLKGFEPELNRPVAVKMLAPHLASSGAARQRFAREAQAAAVIVHPNVMPILSVHSTGRLPYLVMPFVPGESLQERIDRRGALPPLESLRIGLQLARGLAAAHAQGLVHRDIKPANVLLEEGVDRVLLTDFGLARAMDDASLTRSGLVAGTPQYMAPEQARGEPCDARCDLFSLGSVLYTMATGRPPFRAETSYGVLRRITDESPRPIRETHPETPDWFEAIVARLHAKERSRRFESAESLADLLEDCLAHLQQPLALPLPEGARELLAAKHEGAPAAAPARRRAASNTQRWAWRAALVVGILAVGGAVWSQLHDSTGTAPPADNASANLTDSAKPRGAADSSPIVHIEEAELSLSDAWDDGVEERLGSVRDAAARLRKDSEQWP